MISGFEKLSEKASELKAKGLNNREIANELNIQIDTVYWLLLHERERKKAPPPMDYSVNWSCIGSNIRRLRLLGLALADLVKEVVAEGEFEDFDVVVGMALSGTPLGLIVAEELGKPFAAVHFPLTNEKDASVLAGTVVSNFSPVEGCKVLIVNDVISTGILLKDVIKSLRQIRATPVGMVCFVDKRGGGDIEGIPIRSLVNMILVRK